LHLTNDEDTNTLINIALEDMQDFLYKFSDWHEDQVERLNYILLEPLYLGIKGALNIT